MTWWQPLGLPDWAIPSITVIGNPLAEPGDRLAWEIRTVAERLRRLSPARLRIPLPPYASRAQAGRTLAQRLADAAAGVAARDSDRPPQWREVPEIELFAVGEQVAVTGQDLVHELSGAGAGGAADGHAPEGPARAGSAPADTAPSQPPEPLPGDTVIWTRSGRRPLSVVINELLTMLRELRLSL